MKKIKMLSEMIRSELDDAARYAKCAVKYKDEDARLGDMFYGLARAELDHANIEHEQAVRLIKEHEDQATAAMAAVWEWEHEKQIDETARIKQLLEMFKS